LLYVQLFLMVHRFQKAYFNSGYWSDAPGLQPMFNRAMPKTKSPSTGTKAKPAAPAPGKPPVPLQPAGERVGEPPGNLQARENAFKNRRRGLPG
jgi:hypothetical protein